MPEELHRKSLWIGIWQAVAGLIVGLIVSAFIFGRSAGDLRQQIKDVTAWKAEAMPRIDKIDRSGSINFTSFLDNYEKEQGKQYKRLEKLEIEVSHLETLNFRVDKLEKKAGLDP